MNFARRARYACAIGTAAVILSVANPFFTAHGQVPKTIQMMDACKAVPSSAGVTTHALQKGPQANCQPESKSKKVAQPENNAVLQAAPKMENGWRRALTTALGTACGLLTMLAGVPQLIKTLRTRDTCGISINSFLMLTTGLGLWVAYGALLGELPIIIGNSISFCLYSCLLYTSPSPRDS